MKKKITNKQHEMEVKRGPKRFRLRQQQEQEAKQELKEYDVKRTIQNRLSKDNFSE